MRHNLAEDDLLLITGGGLEFLLDETRAVLITAELDNISKDIPQFPLASLVGAEILQERAAKGNRFIPPSRAHSLREPMRTIQAIHAGNKKTDGRVVVQGITLSMRRWS